MSITDIPEKMIERIESLTENKLQVSAELTKLIYSSTKEPITKEQVLKTYFECYEELKELIPPPMEKISLHKVSTILLSILLLTGGFILGYFVTKAYYAF